MSGIDYRVNHFMGFRSDTDYERPESESKLFVVKLVIAVGPDSPQPR